MSRCKYLLLLCLLLSSLCACHHHDDDGGGTHTIACRLDIGSSIDEQLASQLSGTGGQQLRDVLSAYFSSIIYPTTQTITFQFADASTGALRHSETVSMQGQDGEFSFSLPYGDYACTATTYQPPFTGRIQMARGERRHTMTLHPREAQVALVAKVDSTITGVAVSMQDSTTIALPYRQSASTQTRRTYTAPIAPPEASAQWGVTVLATTASGSVTRTVLTISKPLSAGDIRLVQVEIKPDGSAWCADIGVGATVTLNWKDGGQYDTNM